MESNFTSQLIQLFKKNQILDMESIQKEIPDRPRVSIFRDLNKIGYISSYNKAGRYYTLKNIPRFNEAGIWKHEGVFFSTHGTLKETTKYMIDKSKAGHTHSELQNTLDVRVHNTLLDLVSNKEIHREKLERAYVYFHIYPEIRLYQLEERQRQLNEDQIVSGIDPYVTIEVLLAFITQQDRSAFDIYRILSKKGINVTQEEIDTVIQYYDLGKKNSQSKY